LERDRFFLTAPEISLRETFEFISRGCPERGARGFWEATRYTFPRALWAKFPFFLLESGFIALGTCRRWWYFLRHLRAGKTFSPVDFQHSPPASLDPGHGVFFFRGIPFQCSVSNYRFCLGQIL